MAGIILVDDLQEEMRKQTRRVSIMGKILSDFSKGNCPLTLFFRCAPRSTVVGKVF